MGDNISMDIVRDLSMLLDSELTMKHYVNRVASTCFFHRRRLRQLKRHVTSDVVNHLVVAVIDWTAVTRYLQDFRGQPSPHYSESRMPLHDSFWACYHVTMSVGH